MVNGKFSVAGLTFWRRFLGGWPLAVAALATCWISLFDELHREWSVNPQYDYGYVVPLLGAVLLWRRWPERPSPSAGNSVLMGWVAAASLFWLLPLNLFFQANPEWRLLYWFHGLLVLILSFCLLYRAGGWNWAGFFAPPLVFMVIAIPWPTGLEQAVIQHLMRFVAGLTVGVVGWLGIPAMQHGNLIEVGTGVVGIDEACSGVRSLQSALMLSLFLGEIYRFSARRRAALVGTSLICVILANVVRTSFLTWVAAQHGLKQMEAWHDDAGLIVMAIVLPGLFGLGHLMKPKLRKHSPGAVDPHHALPVMPYWVAISVFAWIGLAGAITEGWYRIHERDLVPNTPWTVAWPTQADHFQKAAVPEQSLAILRCSDSTAATWADDEGNLWSAFFLRWNAGKNSAQLAFGHRPDICYPAAGERLVKDYGRITVSAGGIHLPFSYQTFQNGSRLMHVFYCLWSDRVPPEGEAVPGNSTWKSRWQAVLAGQRNLGQQVLEVDVLGPETGDAAVSSFRRELPRLILPE